MNGDLKQQLERILESSEPNEQEFASTFSRYKNERSPEFANLSPVPPNSSCFGLSYLGDLAARAFPAEGDARFLAELALSNLNRASNYHPFVTGFFGLVVPLSLERDQMFPILVELSRHLDVPDKLLAEAVVRYLDSQTNFGWTKEPIRDATLLAKHRSLIGNASLIIVESEPPKSVSGWPPAEAFLAGLADEDLSEIIVAMWRREQKENRSNSRMVASLAKLRPEAMSLWMELAARGEFGSRRDWETILVATDRWDVAMVEALSGFDSSEALLILWKHMETGRTPKHDLILAAISDPMQRELPVALQYLARVDYGVFLDRFRELLESGKLFRRAWKSSALYWAFDAAAARWNDGGESIFESSLAVVHDVIANGKESPGNACKLLSDGVTGILFQRNSHFDPTIEEWVRKVLEAINSIFGDGSWEAQLFWRRMIYSGKGLLINERFTLLGNRAKGMRELAIEGLAEIDDKQPRVADLLGSEHKVDTRLGAAEYLEKSADPAAGPALREALEAESSERVRKVLYRALEACGVGMNSVVENSSQSLPIIESEIAAQAKRTRLPKCSWLELEKLQPLVATSGGNVSREATVYLIAKQSKHKAIELAPDVVPLMQHVDREKNASFALQLVEGFLNSDQAAADRWALTLGGVLGDHRIIPPLLSRIQGWCDNSRHKLAEYAAQAISLLPGDEPLMVLDTLATRYRSKYKNVGRACAAAFEAAATARGITPDELADMVVPSFDFDEDGVRTFAWDGGSISAELGPDFKLQWFDAESEKSWKSMPAFVPDEVKAEVKVLNKMIREAVKGQTARLELTLVRQRRWPVARWRELFERNPVLKSFATRLVWGVYDESDALLRTFRRYPNGLLADAAGAIEEFDGSGNRIGMVHPLELGTPTLEAWRAHLGRMKVKPPFPQLDRAVELLDPLHGNRKEITVVRGTEVSAGTFRSRSEKRGWVRGSVVDAGGISSYYKPYPGAGIEVILPLGAFYIGIDPMDLVDLYPAYFVKAGSVERGSYTYDEPGPDDRRVLRFDQVPAVVYSETVADLKAIVGETSG